ncbi:MAG: hypothetical protein M3252_08165 [Actinomycetota bacterium]|nr:hypothetical protein [Actinomycetota bacterium]
MLEVLLVVAVVFLLLAALGGPARGWFAGIGIVSLLLWVLIVAVIIWLVVSLLNAAT